MATYLKKVVLRYARIIPGAQCVMKDGAALMLELLADN